MTEGDESSHRLLPRIRQELDKLPLTEAEKEQLAPLLLDGLTFFDTRGGKQDSGGVTPDSTVFNIADKVQALVQRFQNDGLTTRDYVKLALRRPQLFYQSPDTTAAHIVGVVDRFAGEGLTIRKYLKAAFKRTALFTMNPNTISENIDGMVGRFADEGLITRAYLDAALKQPQLFSQSPATIAANIEGAVKRFAVYGLTMPMYIKAALKQPSLFSLSPETVAGHITGVIERFAADGLTTREYLKAALKQPSLFAASPETVIRHINAVLSFSDSGIFTPPIPQHQGSQQPETSGNPSHAEVINFLLRTPALLSLADHNFGLRAVHQRLTDGPTNTKMLTRSRPVVERELMRHLGHDDPQLPVPADGFVAGGGQPTDEQAKRIVLRALIHAGFIRSGTVER
jgi:hypothetical protein